MKLNKYLNLKKKELFDPNNIAALIDKSKIETAETVNKTDKITQDQEKSFEISGLSLSEEDALKAQIFGCWSIPLGLPYNENLLVRIKLQLNPDGTVSQSEILDKRETFLEKIKEFEKKYPDENNVPRPPHWSGWRVMPDEIEFWVDGEGRIHERLNYKIKNGKWEKQLLYP